MNKYFKKPGSQDVFAFNEDGSEDAFISEDMVQLTEAEVAAHLAPPVPVVPDATSVTMRQARLALHAAGMLDAISTAIDSLAEPQRTQALIEWEFASTVEKHSPLIQMLAPAIGLDGEALTQLFNTARGL